jgi:type II secretory pathway pseudopilin PulG
MTLLASPRGFTLFETLVATGILVTALAGVAQLFALGSHLTRQANTAGAALVAAQEKLEVLSGLSFDYDPAGVALTDPSLVVSPPSSLDEDIESYVDWINPAGLPSATSDESVFVRRWRVSSIASEVPDSITVEVCVLRMPVGHAGALAADACLSTVRTRQP